jgi:Mrp family chromosome partitioning ATPase
MDRLRIAIDKARAARGEGPAESRAGAGDGTALAEVAVDAPREPARPRGPARAQAQPARRPAAPDAPAALDAVSAAWAEIEAFQPDRKRLERNRVMPAVGGGMTIEIDKLRTRILQQMQANGWRRLAVTSPGPSCGKTTILLNLAYSLARRDGTRVVICEMDLRRPAIADMLGIATRRDFKAVLRGEASFAEHAVRIGDDIAVGTVHGAMRSGSAELLHGHAAQAALKAIEETYEPTVMLLDTPPLLVNDDVLGLIETVDCVLIAAAAGQSTIAQIDACEREAAAQSQVLGVVLNKCRFPERGEGYYDYYD